MQDIDTLTYETSELQSQVRDLRKQYRRYLLMVATLGLSPHASRTINDTLTPFIDDSTSGFRFENEKVIPLAGHRFTSSDGKKELQVYRVTLYRAKKEEVTCFFRNKEKMVHAPLFSMCVCEDDEDENGIDIFLSSKSSLTDVWYFSEDNLPDIQEYVASVRRILDITKEYLEASALV